MPTSSLRTDFDQFRVKNPNFRGAFEDLCYHLFCRAYGAASGVKADFNEAGLETKPVLYQGRHYGYQAKFFDQNMGPGQYKQIEKSVGKALRHFKGMLDVICIYLNKPITSGAKSVRRIEKMAFAVGVKIEWRLPRHFDALLIKPENLDLGQLFFGRGDEFGFFKSNCDPATTTLILSSTHLSIPLKGLAGKDSTEVLASASDKVILLLGQPGAGKSILMHGILLGVGQVRSADLQAMKDAISKGQPLPMLLNLKDCVADTVENVIRNRQRDYDVHLSKNGFIYLFDGLDELSPEKAEMALSYISALAKAAATKRIVVSCRAANPNRYSFATHFPLAKHHELDSLSPAHLEAYFKSRDGGAKLVQFQELKAKVPTFLDEIKDVFLLRLLWETIEQLGPSYSILDLFREKVSLLLDEPGLKKNIEELNLLDPKRDSIISLNEDISLEFQQGFQYRFTREELQRLILKRFPRLSYKDTNALIAYLCSHFFATSDTGASAQDSFIYQHRRYQEYFVARKLKAEYRASRKIIRNNFLSNGDFLQGVFLPFLRQEFERDGDLAGLLELNLIDVYLGKHPGYGADSPGYSLSSNFVPAIVAQQPAVFERIMSDENLQIGKKIEPTPENIVLFWSAGRKEFATDLLATLEARYLAARKRMDDPNEPPDPYEQRVSQQVEHWFYIHLVIKSESISDVFKRFVRGQYGRLPTQAQFGGDVSPREEMVRAFVRVCLIHRGKDLAKVLDQFEDLENLALLDELCQIELLPLFFRSSTLQKHVKKVLAKLQVTAAVKVHAICFFRIVLGLGLREMDRAIAMEQVAKFRESRPIDLHMREGVLRHALLAFALGEQRFDELLRQDGRAPAGPNYFNDLALYSALFAEFVALLQRQRPIQRIVRSYRAYLSSHDRAGRPEYHWHMSQLWVRIFVEAKSNPASLLAMKRLILVKDGEISLLAFLRQMRLLDLPLFERLANEQDIEGIAQELSAKTRETREVVDDCFDLALLLSSLNPDRAVSFISMGLNEGILRHGWRKDVLVSGFLIEALKILWHNNWVPREQLEKYSRQTFDLTMRVAQITDGKGTWRGPNRLLAMIANYDLRLAEEFSKKIGHDSYGHYMRNDALTDILKAKIRLGLSLEEIDLAMKGYGKDYNHDGTPSPSYFEQKLRVYMEVCRDEMFTPAEKRQAFLRAHGLLEEMRKEKVTYFRDLREEERAGYAQLCKKYGKTSNLPKSTDSKFKLPKIAMSEAQFVAKMIKASSVAEIEELFKKLAKYETRIAVQQRESWETIVRETARLDPGLAPLIGYLKEMRYPHTSNWSENSDHLHYVMAAALRSSDTRMPMLKYLYTHSGYEGFTNVMRAMEVNRDKRQGAHLFAEFIAFCDFLVN